MAKCVKDLTIPETGVITQSKATKIYIDLTDDIEPCIELDTDHYTSTSSNKTAYKNFIGNRPTDAYNCPYPLCITGGTLYFQLTEDNKKANATFDINKDAIDYVGGLISYYVYLGQDDMEYTIKTKIKDIDKPDFADADIYEYKIKADKGAGFYPVLIDLASVPKEMAGEGWKATENGITLDLEIEATGDDFKDHQVGFSSIGIYFTKDDLMGDHTIVLDCITSVEGDMSVDVTDPSCLGQDYDPNSVELTKTINFSKATPNYWRLNPFEEIGDETYAPVITNVKKVIEEYEFQGVKYGVVEFSDMYMEDCGFNIAIMHDCDIFEGMLDRVQAPVPTPVLPKEFQVVKGMKNGRPVGMYLFNEELIGQEVQIAYPRKVEAKVYYGTNVLAEGRHARVIIPAKMYNARKHKNVMMELLNVKFTSFPLLGGAWSTEENTEVSLEMTVLPDEQGRYYKRVEYYEFG